MCTVYRAILGTLACVLCVTLFGYGADLLICVATVYMGVDMICHVGGPGASCTKIFHTVVLVV